MAFFKFRKHTDEPATPPRQGESIEAMRKRAKYRLTGAAVLVLIGVVGFPILFDRQPRPIAVDTPIEIPDRNKSKPLTLPITAPAPTAKRHQDLVILRPRSCIASSLPTTASCWWMTTRWCSVYCSRRLAPLASYPRPAIPRTRC